MSNEEEDAVALVELRLMGFTSDALVAILETHPHLTYGQIMRNIRLPEVTPESIERSMEHWNIQGEYRARRRRRHD